MQENTRETELGKARAKPGYRKALANYEAFRSALISRLQAMGAAHTEHPLPDGRFSSEWKLSTVCGSLYISIHAPLKWLSRDINSDLSVYCRFGNPDLARQCSALPHRVSLNTYSGKWNHRFGDIPGEQAANYFVGMLANIVAANEDERALRLAEIKASIQNGSYSDLDPIKLAVTTDEILRECQNRG
jgi:hypothetical protein